MITMNLKLSIIFFVFILMTSTFALPAITKTGNVVLPVSSAIHDNFVNTRTKAVVLDQEISEKRKSFSTVQQQVTSAPSSQKQEMTKTLQAARTALLESLFNQVVNVQGQVFASIENSKKLNDKFDQLSVSHSSDSELMDKISKFKTLQAQLETDSQKINSDLEVLEQSGQFSTQLTVEIRAIKAEIVSLKQLFQFGKEISKQLLKK